MASATSEGARASEAVGGGGGRFGAKARSARATEGLGEGFEAFLALLEPLFGVLFGCLYLECSLEGLLEAPGFDLASILKGLGLVWEGFGGPELVFFRFRNPLA